eukprot:TRINITY_DN4150_c0_g1_i1.p1 TRINITY_DN4150_c0_g1~~TRINITY_DN4150_c0_g1_i1.p1  ORF type:complete len:481 (-),score=122.09 TRINITY_DN4150_c0_g1_i1:238-1680(-)
MASGLKWHAFGLLLVHLGENCGVLATRGMTAHMVDAADEAGSACTVTEKVADDQKYGLKISWQQGQCGAVRCQYNRFVADVWPTIFDSAEDTVKAKRMGKQFNREECVCSYKTKLNVANAPKKELFRFGKNKRDPCQPSTCQRKYEWWGNQWIRLEKVKQATMPAGLEITGQDRVDVGCANSPPGVQLREPKKAIQELQRKAEDSAATPAERQDAQDKLKKLEQGIEVFHYAEKLGWGEFVPVAAGSAAAAAVEELGDEAFSTAVIGKTIRLRACSNKDGSLEVESFVDVLSHCGVPNADEYELEYQYVTNGAWGPLIACGSVDACANLHFEDSDLGDVIEFKLKPCVSKATGAALTNVAEIAKNCGAPVADISLKPVKVMMHWKPDAAWGSEVVCSETGGCAALQAAASQYGELLSYRLKPCVSVKPERGITASGLADSAEHCGSPALGTTFLPEKARVATLVAPDAPAASEVVCSSGR